MDEAPVVHVIDDDEAVRDSLAFLFDSVGMSPRTYESAVAFLRALEEAPAGCVVTDVRMPEMSGLDLLRELRARNVALPIIIITGHGDVTLAVEVMKEGAFDFLEKPFDDDQLINVVRRALERAPVSPSEEAAAAQARVCALSADERQILKRLVDGQLTKTIAFDLGINPREVEVHRARLMAQMEAATFADLVRIALLAGDLTA